MNLGSTHLNLQSLESRGYGVGEYVVDSGSDFTVYVWAEPGEYRLANSVVWVQAEEIEVIGVDGEPRKIRNLIDCGTANYERTFSVAGPEPKPECKRRPKNVAVGGDRSSCEIRDH